MNTFILGVMMVIFGVGIMFSSYLEKPIMHIDNSDINISSKSLDK